MIDKLEELQEALDNRPRSTCQCAGCQNREKWFEDFTRKFATYRAAELAKERSLRKHFQDLFDTIPIEMEKVGRKYEVYSVGTKKQWIEWLVKYSQVFDDTFSISKPTSKRSKELLLGKVLPLCDKCKVPMKVVDVRDDGCRYFECPECGGTVGEETEEWFKEQAKVSVSEHKKEQTK